MDKLLILDKDGTLVKPKSGNTFVQHSKDQELIPGVAETIERYHNDGWITAIASNQDGVAAGYKTLGSAIDEMFYAMCLTNINLAMIAHSYENKYGEAIFLDNTDEGEFWKPVSSRSHKFRKPNKGMLIYLRSRVNDKIGYYLDVIFVGDRPEDQGAAEVADVSFMWVNEWINSDPILVEN